MTFFLLLMLLIPVAATLHALLRDDRGQLPPPSSHPTDPGFAPPARRLHA
ncbi:hypothetical protein [Nocardioides humilatus]|nr:hypothetical protein [Nocardioides humilatus]